MDTRATQPRRLSDTDDHVEFHGPPLADFAQSLIETRHSAPVFVRLRRKDDVLLPVVITTIEATYHREEDDDYTGDLALAGCSENPSFLMCGWTLDAAERTIPNLTPVWLEVWRDQPTSDDATTVLLSRTQPPASPTIGD